MRIFEVLTLLLLLPSIAALLAVHRPLRLGIRLLWILALVAFGIHAFYEGAHWQLLPLYVALFLAGTFLFASQRRLSRFVGAVCLLLVCASLGACWLLPMFRLPQPTGAYHVGTTMLYLVDKSRLEIHTPQPEGPRQLMIQIWYPSDSTEGKLAPYRKSSETTLLSSYMAVLKTHSYLDAPIARASTLFPVLLFNPAWKNPGTQNTYQMEDLASHGFVVVSIDHTYNTQPVAFPGGRVIFSKSTRDIDDFADYPLENTLAYDNAEADYEAQDDSFVLDQLAQANIQPGNRFYHALDTQHAGALGHSFGGGVAMQTALRDNRVLGAINMDGWTFGSVAKAGLPKPLMLMYEPYPVPPPADLNSKDPTIQRSAQLDQEDQANIQATLQAHGGYRLTIPEAKHMNFADRSLYSPLRYRTDSGAIDPVLAHQIVEAYTLAFFSNLLKGQKEPLLQAVPSPFPDARFEIFKPAP